MMMMVERGAWMGWSWQKAFIKIAWAWQLLPKGVKWQTRRANDDEANSLIRGLSLSSRRI